MAVVPDLFERVLELFRDGGNDAAGFDEILFLELSEDLAECLDQLWGNRSVLLLLIRDGSESGVGEERPDSEVR